MVILSQDNGYRNRFQIHNLQKKSLCRNDATSSEVNNGYIQSMSTGARSDSDHRKLIQCFEQVLRVKTADSGFLTVCTCETRELINDWRSTVVSAEKVYVCTSHSKCSRGYVTTSFTLQFVLVNFRDGLLN